MAHAMEHTEALTREFAEAAYRYAVALVDVAVRGVPSVRALPKNPRLDLHIQLAAAAAVVLDLQDKPQIADERATRAARARFARRSALLLRLERELLRIHVISSEVPSVDFWLRARGRACSSVW